MKLHVAVQHVVDAIVLLVGKEVSLGEMETLLEAAWDSHGPADHGYSDEYKRIAWQLLRFYAHTVSDQKTLPVPQLRLPVAGGEIVITPDQMVKNRAGKIVMRRVDTGHKGSKDQESLAAAAFHIAANSHTPGCTVELVYLSDAAITPIDMTQRVLGNRRDKIVKMGTDLKLGKFPLEESMTCPRCPAYFICGRLPAGPLVKKYST
jgi:hypothetical protein